jgi:hypothetical protein
MKKIFKILGIIVSIVIFGMAIVFLFAWRSPAYYELTQEFNSIDSIVPFKDYEKISNHPRPLILKNSVKPIIIFGASHTRDPKALEIPLIEKEWEALKPTVALVEGRLGFLFRGLMDPVSTLGEGGKVKELAEENNIPIYNWDVSKSDLMKQLVKVYSPEQVALAQILNPYFSNLRFGKPSSPETFIQEYLKRVLRMLIAFGKIISLIKIGAMFQMHMDCQATLLI